MVSNSVLGHGKPATAKIALLGRDIANTKSPAVHKAIVDSVGIDVAFDVFDMPYDRLGEGVEMLLSGYDGFFVANPYKSEINRYIQGAGLSVNVVRCADKTAYSTDGIGFISALDKNFVDWQNRINAVLVLGTGGAAYSVVEALTALGKKAYVLGRSMVNAVRLASKFDDAQLYSNQPAEMIVNCTPLGTCGEDALAAFCILPAFEYAFDLVYTDTLTSFLRRCRNNGSATANGADMMIYRAIEGCKIILENNFDSDDVYERAVAILRERGVLGGEQ